MTLVELWQFLSAAGLPGGMLLFIYAVYKGWIVMGREYQEKARREEALQAMVDKLTNAALDTIDIVKRGGS